MSPNERKLAAARALPMIDLTDLTENCNHDSIEALCTRAQTEFGPVGAICIWPRFVAHAHKLLVRSGIPIATVVNFPGGNQSVDMTVVETATAIADGVNEIDLVMPYQALKVGQKNEVNEMLQAVREVSSKKALLKVIIEAGELNDPTLIRKASNMAIAAGADFIKTSTGKVPINATPEFAEIMIQAIADNGKNVGFKPAGGIKSTEDTAVYLAIADRIMGPQWANCETFRFGASSVLDDILSALRGGSAVKSEGY